MPGWRIESGIDEVEVTNTPFHFQFLDLVGDELRIARAISPTLDIPVSAVDALVHATALCLDRNGRAVSLVPREIYPAMEAGPRKRVEIGVFAWRSEYDPAVPVAHESGHRHDRRARAEGIDQSNARPLAVAGDGVVDGQISKQRFRRYAECRATGDDFRRGRGLTQSDQHVARFRSVVPEGDSIAVVDVPNGDATDIRPESA